MAYLVCDGSTLTCSFGTGPSQIAVPPVIKVNAGKMAAGTITDNKPMVNIKPFVMCTTPSNPQVAAATAAAQGVLTPVSCIPVIPASWTPGSPNVCINRQPALNSTCQLLCQWGGVISVSKPSQSTVNIS